MSINAMVYCVGITGDIASGKTTVSKLFSKLGIDVIYADEIAKELTQKKLPVYEQIVAHYGFNILTEHEELNRKMLREIIFSNHKEREWLEKLLHPLIRQELKKRVDVSTGPYCIVEIPLLITKEVYPYIKRILLISAPKELQLYRIMERDQCTKEQALTILSTQPNRDLRLHNADDVINNNLSIEELMIEVNKLHQSYLLESNRPSEIV